MAYCYILCSTSLNRYYVGSTALKPGDRLQNHLKAYYGSRKFTAKARDWKIFLEIECDTIATARKIERQIKKMKSRKYIENLKDYPELVGKLRQRFSCDE